MSPATAIWTGESIQERKTNEIGDMVCIFQAFDMEKFFDKEGLIDTRGKISEKDYGLWVRLNNRTRFYIQTPVGGTDNATILNDTGQGSFAAALASSITIGSAVYDITKGEVLAIIGNTPLNCLIFQDNIVKMNRTLENARKGAKDE